MKKSKKKFSKILPLIFLLLFVIIFILTNYQKSCGYDKDCFDNSLNKCAKAKYFSEEEGSLFEYKITGKSQDNCLINIKLINLESQDELKNSFVGKSMTCYLPLDKQVDLETIEYCTGPLKEAMYELMIQKMYNILAQSLGEIMHQLE
jgi:hypothetical protein